MDIAKAFEVAFNRKIEKNWEKIYVVVDIHDTILRKRAFISTMPTRILKWATRVSQTSRYLPCYGSLRQQFDSQVLLYGILND